MAETLKYLKCRERPSLLLVDDEEEILTALSDLLEDEYRIFATYNPLTALEILREHPEIVTIISDQRMPGLTGERFLAQAREISDARSILLTGYADLEAVVSALNDGHVQAYIHKPWDRATLLSMIAEVTQHGLSQRALCTEQALLKSLMSTLPIRLVFSNEEGRHIRSNMTPSVKKGMEVCELQCEDEAFYHRAALLPFLEEMRKETAKNGHSERLITTEEEDEEGRKKTVIYEITRFALSWPSAKGQNFEKSWQVSLERDVTEKICLDRRLRQAERLESLGTLAGGIAHDFNNLLAAISGPLEILRKIIPEDKEQHHEILDHAQNAVRRGTALTRRLLQVGRARRDDVEEKLIPIEIGSFFTELKSILEQSIYRSPYGDVGKECQRCTVSFKNILENQQVIFSDPQQLEMALLNLCVNARDAMPQGGNISIEAHLLENYYKLNDKNLPPECSPQCALALDICDEGEGMPPEIISRIFDPFFTTKSIERGTGLGLSGVYGFMQRNYGDILVESQIGVGTKMRLIFPLYRQEEEGKPVSIEDNCIETASNKPPIIRKEMLSLKNLSILVMDDEEALRDIIEEFLCEEGMNVRVAGRLEEAISLIEAGFRPDIALLDVQMPEKMGPECLTALKKHFPSLKVLFMSGHVGSSLLNDYAVIAKPFTQMQLRRALSECVSS